MTWGMKALKDGVISPAQFAELNARIGDVNIDFQPITSRRAADTASVRAAYRSGAVNEANNLNTVAILDGSGPNDPGTEHPTVPAFMLRARLDRNFGEHANQAIWGGPVQIIGNVDFFRKGLIAMDGWLAAIARDHSTRLLAQKIIADRPADMHDTCFNGLFGVVNSGLCSFVPVYSFPRVVAGEPLTNDVMQCQLKPLQRSDFPVTFTTSEWAGLESAFPTGICDFSKPGVDQQPTRPWQTYQTASGSVIYGGKPMGPPPQSVACTNHTRPVHGLQPCTQTQAAKRSHKPAP
jgi:hypothetical protein